MTRPVAHAVTAKPYVPDNALRQALAAIEREFYKGRVTFREFRQERAYLVGLLEQVRA